MSTGNGSDIAAVDKLARTVDAAVRALNQNVDAVLVEAINYLNGAQEELVQINARIEQARRELTTTRDGWQRPIQDKTEKIEAPLPPAPNFLQKSATAPRN